MSRDLAEPAFEQGEQENPSNDQIRGPDYQEHIGSSRQYWRDIILGVNDGLVSTFLLVAGVAGSGLDVRDILLTAIAGALAGAVSMAAGEYMATKSQNEVMMVRKVCRQVQCFRLRINANTTSYIVPGRTQIRREPC